MNKRIFWSGVAAVLVTVAALAQDTATIELVL